MEEELRDTHLRQSYFQCFYHYSLDSNAINKKIFWPNFCHVLVHWLEDGTLLPCYLHQTLFMEGVLLPLKKNHNKFWFTKNNYRNLYQIMLRV